ncbi:hypothetical protein HIY_08670 [Haemophilus influenzae]|nr:hypothetical protein CHBNII3_07640 [Haemophilus influenzae]BBE87732.1 hypothetical protein CHBNII4_07570 [Haemophilus influenzae]BBE91142.1 hypothetical protein CHBNII6_07490 [Haemophilus influenzae]BBE92918.1 hypothetical protein CHBNII7_08220 [Haemophilus influenzae]BCB66322.1 hypothetical protein HIY_08670 [Haemophilus influenzae]
MESADVNEAMIIVAIVNLMKKVTALLATNHAVIVDHHSKNKSSDILHTLSPLNLKGLFIAYSESFGYNPITFLYRKNH